jgi:hypothetical protein
VRRGLEGRGTVAEVGDGDATRKVKVLLAVNIGYPRAFSFDNVDLRVIRDDGGDEVAKSGREVGHDVLLVQGWGTYEAQPCFGGAKRWMRSV